MKQKRRWVRSSLAAALLLRCGLTAAPPEGELVDFSFDQVEITAFVKTVAELTGKNLAVADDVKGRITVIAPAVKRDEVYGLFASILETAGCTVVQDGGVYRVVTLPKRNVPVAPVVGVEEEIPEAGLVTKVLHLNHVRASDVSKALEGQVERGTAGRISAVDETNHLIVTDTAAAVRRIEKVIQEIDQPGMSRTAEVVPLEYAGAEEMAQELTQAMTESQTRGDILKTRLPTVIGSREDARRIPTIVASPHANRLILVGSQTQLEELKALIKEMDVDPPTGRGRLNTIILKYTEAEEIAKSLAALLEVPVLDKKEQTGPKRRRIAIQASASNNAILIDGTASDFEAVKRLIEQLDVLPQQVHIEVLIAEKSTTDAFEFGVEFAALQSPSGVGDTTVQGGSTFSDSASALMNVIQDNVFPSGLSVGLAHGSYADSDGNVVSSYPAALNVDAVRKNGHYKVLSRTSLEAQNNREASVNIVNEIPVLKSTIEGGSGTSRDVIQNIERIEVGIKLKLKPHVVPGGEVQMVLSPSIEAVINPGSTDTEFTPTIARRGVETTVTVPDSRTIVIAGLTREDTTKTEKRVPILGSIPLLGWLFRNVSDSTEKTDLLIFVTPTIVKDSAASNQISAEWQDKTGLPGDEDE